MNAPAPIAAPEPWTRDVPSSVHSRFRLLVELHRLTPEAADAIADLINDVTDNAFEKGVAVGREPQS